MIWARINLMCDSSVIGWFLSSILLRIWIRVSQIQYGQTQYGGVDLSWLVRVKKWVRWLSWSCSWWLSPSHHHLHHGEGVYYQFIGIAWMIMVVQVIIIIRYLILCRYLQETFDFNQCNQSLFGKKGLCLVIGWCGLGLMIVTWTTEVAFGETYYVYLHVISFWTRAG